jgi:hypothetical protein
LVVPLLPDSVAASCVASWSIGVESPGAAVISSMRMRVSGSTACISGNRRLAANSFSSEMTAPTSSPGSCRISKSKLHSRGTILSAVPPWITPVWTDE